MKLRRVVFQFDDGSSATFVPEMKIPEGKTRPVRHWRVEVFTTGAENEYEFSGHLLVPSQERALRLIRNAQEHNKKTK